MDKMLLTCYSQKDDSLKSENPSTVYRKSLVRQIRVIRHVMNVR